MFRKKFTTSALFVLIAVGAIVIGCEENTSYDQRVVMYVSRINDGLPYFSDVLCQGDSIYYEDGVTFKRIDDYVQEDFVKITFHNKPYNYILDPCTSSLGDFLVTDYDVAYTRLDGDSIPVPPFRGKTSILVPAATEVEAYVLLVPFYAKNELPLRGLRYGTVDDEILAQAHFTFYGHEVQTKRNMHFSAGVTVNFADVIVADQ